MDNYSGEQVFVCPVCRGAGHVMIRKMTKAGYETEVAAGCPGWYDHDVRIWKDCPKPSAWLKPPQGNYRSEVFRLWREQREREEAEVDIFRQVVAGYADEEGQPRSKPGFGRALWAVTVAGCKGDGPLAETIRGETKHLIGVPQTEAEFEAAEREALDAA